MPRAASGKEGSRREVQGVRRSVADRPGPADPRGAGPGGRHPVAARERARRRGRLLRHAHVEVLAADRAPVEGELPDDLAVSAPTRAHPSSWPSCPPRRPTRRRPSSTWAIPSTSTSCCALRWPRPAPSRRPPRSGRPAAAEAEAVEELEEAQPAPEQEIQAPAPQRSPLVAPTRRRRLRAHGAPAAQGEARDRGRREAPEAPKAPRRAAKSVPPVVAPPEVDEAAELVSELTRAGVAPDVAPRASSRWSRPRHAVLAGRGAALARARPHRRRAAHRVGWAPTGAPHLVALAGPTGSGKTSLAVKLVERYVEAGMSAAVITLRAARPDRDSLAARMGGGASGGGVLRRRRPASASPVGRGPRAAARSPTTTWWSSTRPGVGRQRRGPGAHRLLAELEPDEVHAALPLRSRARDGRRPRLAGAPRRRPHAVTKIDEARAAGTLLDLASRSEMPLSYMTCGLRIPGDMALADGVLIAQRILPI